MSNNTEALKLAPCPFCGHETPYFERMGTPRQSCIVVCGDCGARHESSDEGERSGSSWNTRAALAQAEQAQPVAPAVTPAMVDSYLSANALYWQRIDAEPTKLGKWRNGTPREATEYALNVALAAPPAAPQPLIAGLSLAEVKERIALLGADDLRGLVLSLSSQLWLTEGLLAAAPQPQAAQQAVAWQPIETAPIGDDDLLNAIVAYPIESGAYFVEEAWWDSQRREWWPANTDYGDAVGEPVYPTHWMPLPVAPGGAAPTQAAPLVALTDADIEAVLAPCDGSAFAEHLRREFVKSFKRVYFKLHPERAHGIHAQEGATQAQEGAE